MKEVHVKNGWWVGVGVGVGTKCVVLWVGVVAVCECTACCRASPVFDEVLGPHERLASSMWACAPQQRLLLYIVRAPCQTYAA